MSDTETKAAPAAYVPPSQVGAAELAKALQEDGVEVPNSPKEAAPAPAAAPPEPVKELPALVRIAKERDALRKEAEAAKHLGVLKEYSPIELQRLAQARKEGDPVAALAALGFTHSQYNSRLAGVPESKENYLPEPESEVSQLRQQLEEIKREKNDERFQTQRSEVFSRMQTVLEDEAKWGELETQEDLEGIERQLIDFHAVHKTLPAETFEESVAMAAEAYLAQKKELAAAKEKSRWRKKGLTPPASSAPVAAKAPEQPKTGTATSRTLTNSNTTSPAAPRSTPKTRQEIIDDIINEA